ncbi:MAG TPA: carcinine hydrolase/isopenicillin-N N-acyltransferase family protein [Candidatus Hydrogenedentes bacterium]|nr:carcinine hydrolase/isopenicillin-N N-acyltransferase family protein [Candidatus Hydrogenedentota bacterium]HPG68908.1 carcinine hydrolase/isopenicillin-N N-acyltransferase family protein [Candidatus Hydrogenedentota bacterium]
MELCCLIALLTAGTEVQTVALEGSPEVIGRTWGRINAEHIKADIRAGFLDLASEKGVSEHDLIERSQRFVEICSEIAPHWLVEADAIAEAAGVNAALYRAYIGSVYRNLWQGDECTSYAVRKEYTKDGAIFFHKNRDNREKPQAACVVASDVPGVNRFITVSDAAVLACMMMVNDKGLAGSADMGGLPVVKPRFRGMMNTFLLRHIAERAASCAEAEAIVRDFVTSGRYAGGGSTGTHWLFVDKTGEILEISNNSDQVTTVRHDEKVYFSMRAETNAASILRHATEPVDFHRFHNVSRDPSMCFESSICGMTVEIDAEHPALLTCAWITLPAKGLAFPLLMGCRATPRPLVNGEVYALSKDIDGKTAEWERHEEDVHKEKELIVARAREQIGPGDRAAAITALEHWTVQATARGIDLVRAYR